MAFFKAASELCEVCITLQTGKCINETCVCHPGFVGPVCADRVTTSVAQLSASQINISAVLAGILGGIFFGVIVSLMIFFIWKRRVKKKSFALSSSTIATNLSSSIPVVVPALYDISSSRRASSVTSAPTMTYHLYEELL